MKPVMSSFKQLSLLSLTAALLLTLGGCGGDGKNASDNPSSAPQIIPSDGPGDGAGLEPLPEAGAARLIDSIDEGDVESARAVVDGSGNVTVVWTQYDGPQDPDLPPPHLDLWASRYNVGAGGWSSAQQLELKKEDTEVALDVKAYQMVVDLAGNVTVVWSQAMADSYTTGPVRTDVERTDLWAARFSVAESGWGKGERIESANLGATTTEAIEDIGEFKVVVDGADEVSVLWTQHNGSQYDLYANRSVAGIWDATPTLVDSENLGHASSPQLLVDATGKLFAFWTQSDGARLNLWGAHYAAGWSAAAKLDSEDAGDVEAPVAVVDNDGAATVAWRQFDGSYWSLWTRRYAGSWGGAEQAEALSGDVSTPQLLVYGTTGVMLLWVQSDGVVNNVWSKHYAGAWVDDGNITDDSGNAGSVVMVKDGAGAVTAVWVQHDATALKPVDNLWANRFSAGSWGSASLIETGNSGDVRSPMLMADRRGTDLVSVIWLQADGGRFDLWSNHYSNGLWGSAGLVEGLDEGSAVDPHAVMDGNGNITLIWRHPYDSSSLLVTNRYTVSAVSGWGSVAEAGSTEYDGGYAPQVLVDGSGAVTVIWLQPVAGASTARVDLYANRF